ncbi:MAG TPA: hypothetical protein V6C97_00095, partial [Oculatellaceae cyanobacterium]
MVTFVRDPVCVNGVFLVPKSDQKWRLIIDAQSANVHFSPPPHVELPSPSNLAGLICDRPFYVAKMDLDNYYHRLSLPDSYHRYFGLPSVRAGDISGELAAMFGEDTIVFPCCTTLPMGWSHSVFLAHSGHLNILSEAGIRAGQIFVNKPVTRVSEDPVHLPYIDDLNTFGTEPHLISADMERVRLAYGRKGLVVKESKCVGPCSVTEVLGLEADGAARMVGLSHAKLHALHDRITSFLERQAVSGKELAALLGSLTWAALVRRPLLSVFRSAYRFVHTAGDRTLPLWPSVCRELVAARGLLPLFFASL